MAHKQYFLPMNYKTASGDWIEIDFLQYGEVAGLSAEDKATWDADLAAFVEEEQAFILAGTYTDPATSKWPTANVTVNGGEYYPARMFSITSDIVDHRDNFTTPNLLTIWGPVVSADENCLFHGASPESEEV